MDRINFITSPVASVGDTGLLWQKKMLSKFGGNRDYSRKPFLRGKVSTFSKSASARMRLFVIRHVKIGWYHVTVTFPLPFGNVRRRQWLLSVAKESSLARSKWSGVSFIWRKEVHSKGNASSGLIHYHLLCPRWVDVCAIVDMADGLTSVTPVTTGGIAGYLCDHATKKNQIGNDVGRHWGVVNKTLMNCLSSGFVSLGYWESVEVGRFLRRVSRRRRNFGTHTFFTLESRRIQKWACDTARDKQANRKKRWFDRDSDGYCFPNKSPARG